MTRHNQAFIFCGSKTMSRFSFLLALAAVLAICPAARCENWPEFRGPTGQGVSTARNLPVEWSSTNNVAWKQTIPGKGCFLAENHSPFNKQVRQKLLLKEIDEAVVTAHHLQVDRDAFLELVEDRLDFFERKAAAGKHGA